MASAVRAASEPAEVIRGAYDAFNRRDVPAFLARLHPDVRWYTLDLTIKPRFLRGREEVGGFIDSLLQTSAVFTTEPEEMRSTGELVLVRICHRSRREALSPETTYRVVHLWTVRDGQIVKHRFYLAMSKAAKAFSGHAGTVPRPARRADSAPLPTSE
jgi:ketosteroid isomerase-like protein